MLSAKPAAQMTRAQTDAVAERSMPPALDAKMAQNAVHFLHHAPPGGAGRLIANSPLGQA